jgi:hypothetical protein
VEERQRRGEGASEEGLGSEGLQARQAGAGAPLEGPISLEELIGGFKEIVGTTRGRDELGWCERELV